MKITSTLTPPAKVLLRISFDADQRSDQLRYRLIRETPDTPDPDPTEGLHADSLYFSQGEQVGVEIIGSGSHERKFDSFQIVDCAIITRPQVVQCGVDLKTLYCAPSPFVQAAGAICPLALDFSASINPLKKERTVIQTWKQTLDIGCTPGLWELSFVMTVRITREPGSVEAVRVLSFDPESEVGGIGTMAR